MVGWNLAGFDCHDYSRCLQSFGSAGLLLGVFAVSEAAGTGVARLRFVQLSEGLGPDFAACLQRR